MIIMTSKLLDVGFRNFVNFSKVLTVCNPASAPSRRFIKNAREDNRLIDLTEGKKTRSLIIQESANGLIGITSYHLPRTIRMHLNELNNQKESIE